MRSAQLTAFFVFLFIGHCSAFQSRIELVTPNIQQEATSIWRTINDISFLEAQGYVINLPRHATIDSLITKSKKDDFGNDDYPVLIELLRNEIFDPTHYQIASQQLEAQFELINGLILKLERSKSNWDWDFKMFDSYKINLTLHGTGGSYDPDEGTITLLTTVNGGFKNYINPANTIMHEIVHIGIENSIVGRYELSHPLKERLVDRIVLLLFKQELPDYKMQPMGDDIIDGYLKNVDDLSMLPEIIEQIIKN